MQHAAIGDTTGIGRRDETLADLASSTTTSTTTSIETHVLGAHVVQPAIPAHPWPVQP